MFQVTFWCSPVRSIFAIFFLRFCFDEFGLLLSNVDTKPQFFAASVLKDLTIFLPKYFSPIWFSSVAFQLSYIRSKMHCVSSGIQDLILLLLDIILSLESCERSQKRQKAVSNHFGDNEDFFIEMYFFLDNGLKSQQWKVQLFWNKIKFGGFTVDFKGSKRLFRSKCLVLDKRKRP